MAESAPPVGAISGKFTYETAASPPHALEAARESLVQVCAACPRAYAAHSTSIATPNPARDRRGWLTALTGQLYRAQMTSRAARAERRVRRFVLTAGLVRGALDPYSNPDEVVVEKVPPTMPATTPATL